MNVTYTEEAIVDIVEAINYLHERNPTAAANLDAEIAQCIERLAAQEFDGRHRGELLIVRVYHQRRRPITR